MNALFTSLLPELIKLLSEWGFGWSPVKDGESLMELVALGTNTDLLIR